MSDEALRSAMIRLAHSNPELRPHLLPILAGDKKAVSGPSVFGGIMQGLADMTHYVRVQVSKARFEGLTVDSNYGRAGSFGYGFNGIWTSQHDPSDRGRLELGLLWDPAKKTPKVYVSCRWDRYTSPVMEEVTFGMNDPAAKVARWVENVILAFEQNVAMGAYEGR